ncbi:hypothetical protein [Pseudoalteromonas agarivorans]|uniref:Uncharacterized protein n=1 Tax=Pseudoalteromonas agarivorans TaxID=176102 RepID=A0AAD0U410_9GAMM|nr:hypothetical protein [Pseudoalteromonas agarivorans]AYM86864.1 hypothetical protein D9T18_09160 [Pseudoalteromonas agarivorans]
MTKKQRLIDAFERLKAGKPIRISEERKISPSAVEDEAGVSRSLLRNNNEYEDLFKQIVEAKKAQSESVKTGLNKKLSSIDPVVKELEHQLAKSKMEVKEWQKKYSKLLACNAELTQVILEQRFESYMSKVSSDEVDNVFDHKEKQ